MTTKGSLYRKCLNELTISRLCALSGVGIGALPDPSTLLPVLPDLRVTDRQTDRQTPQLPLHSLRMRAGG